MSAGHVGPVLPMTDFSKHAPGLKLSVAFKELQDRASRGVLSLRMSDACPKKLMIPYSTVQKCRAMFPVQKQRSVE